MEKFNAVVLAGDRGQADPVAQAANTFGKAAVEFQSVSLLERILSTLRQAQSVEQIFIVGPNSSCLEQCPHLSDVIKEYGAHYLVPAMGPSASAAMGIRTAQRLPILITTCDLPLLNADSVDLFCQHVASIEADFVAGAVEYEHIGQLIPELKKTQYTFDGQKLCFANLFAVLEEPGLRAIEYWQSIEKSRKKPLEMVKKIDWMSLVRYKMGLLSLDQVERVMSRKIGARLRVQLFARPEMAIDVDTAHDYKVMNKYLG